MPSPLSAVPDLIARIRAGDRSAFETVFREHYAALCDFAYRYLQSREAAEDLVQDVFLSVWTRRESWELRDGVQAYLYGAVRNRALNAIEHQRVEHRWAERARQEHDCTPPASAVVDEDAGAETVATVRAAIDRLPERARLAITLRWQHGLKYAEIAAVMSISVKGVENQLARAMVMLRDEVAGRY